MKKFSRRFLSCLLTVTMLFSIVTYGLISALSFDISYITSDGMKLGYSIINGYTKLAIKNNGMKNSKKTAVYSGLDATKPYNLLLVGLFYVSHGVDLEKIMSDNNYAMSVFSDLNDYFYSKDVENSKAKKFKAEYLSNKKLIYSFDTIGMFIFEESDENALSLMKNENVDFVLTGGEIPKNLKDLNLDGITDNRDAKMIQQYLAKTLTFSDKDEKEYAKFASDYNSDKKINILDVTDIQRKNKN